MIFETFWTHFETFVKFIEIKLKLVDFGQGAEENSTEKNLQENILKGF